ncbi:MAG: Na+/H+ antiporter NhaA [Flavobacteriales bacterium]|nr:Na+/H+ antiporter NhaA [Flavobacteriales bacterium]
MRLTVLFKDFFASEKASGILLVLCTMVSLGVSNSMFGEAYVHLWHTVVAGHPLEFWINDGLMTVFFLMVGLELEREVYIGELSMRSQAMLPAIAALGGMLVPAGIHLLFNAGTSTASGAGIPMATDIAFAIGILSLLGNRVPTALKVFLTALAVIDDLGAIITIAVFYTSDLSWADLGFALALFGVLLVLNRLKVYRLLPYLVLGGFMWFFMLRSGVHATISGVLLAFAIPFGNGDDKSISYKLQHFLHKPVAFGIMPLFALANTCIVLGADSATGLFSHNSLGIFLGLVLGKPVGIGLFAATAVALGWSMLPTGVNWKQLIGVGCLGGIGFTMSIFVALLAFDDPSLIEHAKTAILCSSTVAALSGTLWLWATLPKLAAPEE